LAVSATIAAEGAVAFAPYKHPCFKFTIHHEGRWFRGGFQEWLDKGMPVVKIQK
jgi:hypothetical protein